MPKETEEQAPKFLTVEEVTRLNAEIVQRSGEPFHVREPGYLESAVLTPQQKVFGQYLHPTREAQAGAYLYHITQNHVFENGNKRTAIDACDTFLRQNGRELDLTREERFALAQSVARGELSKDELLRRVSENTRAIGEAREQMSPSRLQVEVERGEEGRVYRSLYGLAPGEPVHGKPQMTATHPETGKKLYFTSETLEPLQVMSAVDRDKALDRDIAQAKLGQNQDVDLGRERSQEQTTEQTQDRKRDRER